MATSEDYNDELPERPREVKQELDAMDRTLADQIDEDERVQSGIPSEQRGSDLDFIQMTGLTRPASLAEPAPTPVQQFDNSLDPDDPVSFYEEGVADVDASMEPPSLDHASGSEDEEVVVGKREDRSPIAGLKEIIADLTREETADEPEPPVAEYGEVDTRAPLSTLLPPEEDTTIEASSSGPEEEEPTADDVPEKVGDTKPPAEIGSQCPAPDDEIVPVPVAPEEAGEEPEEVVEAAPPEAQRLSQVEGAPSVAGAEEACLPSLKTSEADDVPMQQPGEARDEEVKQAAVERDSSVYRRPQTRAQRRRSKRQGRRRRKLIRWGVRLVVLIAVGILGYSVLAWSRAQLASPESQFAAAERLADEGRYRQASEAYLDFANRYPSHPLTPDAEFEAAFLLQRIEEPLGNAGQAARERALELFGQFVMAHPTHTKVARAEGLMGILNFQLHRYWEAIDVLRDPELQLRDAGIALPAMRTLARAYASLGDYAAAESAYLQAVSISENYTPEVDYHELGRMYHRMAEKDAVLATRREHMKKAIQYWDHAVRSPAIDPIAKKEIQRQRDVLQSQLEETYTDVPAADAADPVGDSLDEAVAAEPDPRAEQAFLNVGAEQAREAAFAAPMEAESLVLPEE